MAKKERPGGLVILRHLLCCHANSYLLFALNFSLRGLEGTKLTHAKRGFHPYTDPFVLRSILKTPQLKVLHMPPKSQGTYLFSFHFSNLISHSSMHVHVLLQVCLSPLSTKCTFSSSPEVVSLSSLIFCSLFNFYTRLSSMKPSLLQPRAILPTATLQNV